MIKLENVSKRFLIYSERSKHYLWALKNINMVISKKECVAIIGRNASGKTTLLKIIAGILPPTEGKVSNTFKTVSIFDIHSGLREELSGWENIYFFASLLGYSKKFIDSQINSIINFSELNNFITLPLGMYSEGMKMRLGFSILVHLNFDLLIIDEMLITGDIYFQNRCKKAIIDMKKEKSIIFVSQDINLVRELADRGIVLEEGKIIFDGEPQDAINIYLRVLNEKRFSERKISKIEIRDTKKWSQDSHKWGTTEGNGKIVIKKVRIMNRWNLSKNLINLKEPFKVKVDFESLGVEENIIFGVAIFREDGVYCYGPNTFFDGYRIIRLFEGEGQFIIDFTRNFLNSDSYLISVAIWGNQETITYDYHIGCYPLRIIGNNFHKSLAHIKFFTEGLKEVNEHISEERLLKENSQSLFEICEEKNLFLQNIEFLTVDLKKKELVTLKDNLEINLYFNDIKIKDYLWRVSIYRKDGICCWSKFFKLPNYQKVGNIIFPKINLLPGKYLIRVEIFNSVRKQLMYSNNVEFCMVSFDVFDHGTVYLPHRWLFKLPKGSVIVKDDKQNSFSKYSYS